MKPFNLLLLTLLLAGGLSASAQRQPSLEISIFQEMVGLPFDRSHLGPLHPGLQASLLLPQRQGERAETFWALNMGGYYHRELSRSLYLSGAYGYRRQLLGGFYAEARAGLGYQHNWADHAIFEPTDEGFRQKRDWGTPQVTLSGQVGLGYQWGPKERPYRIFAIYQSMNELPFAWKNGLPALPHRLIHLGFAIPLNFFTPQNSKS